MLEKLGINTELENLSKEVENEINGQFKAMDEICEKNSMKVLSAFQECNLQEMHLNSSTGYGIDEIGRNKIEDIYADIFGAYDNIKIDPASVTRSEYENGGAWEFDLYCDEPVPNVGCDINGIKTALDGLNA